MAWWHLYRATIEGWPPGSRSTTYTIVTDQGELKAAAMAGAIHRGQGGGHIWSVRLVDEGPVPRDADGVAVYPGDAYDDRMEW
jgi:hypothetical protein